MGVGTRAPRGAGRAWPGCKQPGPGWGTVLQLSLGDRLGGPGSRACWPGRGECPGGRGRSRGGESRRVGAQEAAVGAGATGAPRSSRLGRVGGSLHAPQDDEAAAAPHAAAGIHGQLGAVSVPRFSSLQQAPQHSPWVTRAWSQTPHPSRPQSGAQRVELNLGCMLHACRGACGLGWCHRVRKVLPSLNCHNLSNGDRDPLTSGLVVLGNGPAEQERGIRGPCRGKGAAPPAAQTPAALLLSLLLLLLSPLRWKQGPHPLLSSRQEAPKGWSVLAEAGEFWGALSVWVPFPSLHLLASRIQFPVV